MFPMLLASLALSTGTPNIPEVQATEFVVPADDWARPRSGERVVALPSLRAAALAWLDEGDGMQVLIVHPGGEDGALWGAEVRDWLVALGFTPAHLMLRPGSPRDDAVVLRREPRR